MGWRQLPENKCENQKCLGTYMNFITNKANITELLQAFIDQFLLMFPLT